jgi:phage tail-like protein
MVYYPPVGFHFAVVFALSSASRAEANFQEVGGLEASMEMESVKEGGENRFVHRLPLQPTYGNLVLKRGMLVNSELIQWFHNAILNYEFVPLHVTVKLLNQKQEPVAIWLFNNAIPVKWSTSNLNAEESSIVVESIELSYTYMERKSLTGTQADTPATRPGFEQEPRTAIA